VNFCEAEIYLLSLGNEVEAMKLGLENIRKLLAALGNPETNYLKVQIAGTNGKGSVCAFLDSICREAGIEVGVFTSPHLVSITERVRINGVDISDEEFARIATAVRGTAENLVANGELETVPTYFEQVTAISLVAFAEAKVRLAILETGMGGRYDATTAANAEIAAITRIDLDHQEYLGETLAEIAAEKAAIVSPGAIVIVGEQVVEAGNVIVERCRRTGVAAKYADFVDVSSDGGELVFKTDLADYHVTELGLAGCHQIENAKITLLLAEELARRFTVLKSDMTLGLRNARHPGRLEYRGRYLFDGAHNISGAKALRKYLNEFVPQQATMIFGAMRGKDINEIARILFPRAENIILTRPDNSRAMTAAELAAASKDLIDHDRCFLTENVTDAIAKADDIAEADSIILITGSLYLVGDAKKIVG
jgi:dihydrofolate synthase/folylpolyglutamate synthase